MESTNHFLKMDKSLRASELNLLEQYIICQIAEFIGNGRECYVTNRQFAEWTKYSLSQIEKTMKTLEDKHVIKRDIVKFPKKKMRVLSLYPRPEWDVKFDETEGESESANGSVHATDKGDEATQKNSPSDTHTVNSTVPSPNHTVNSTATSESNRNMYGIIDNIEKDNRLEIDNSTPNGDSTANAATNLDTSAYTMKFVNQISDERCIELSKELTRNYTSSGGEFYIKLNTLRTKYGAEPKKHIDFETLYKMANSRARDIENQKRLKAEQGRELNSITTEEAASILSEVLGDYESKVSYTPLNEPSLNINIFETHDVKNHLVDCIGIRSNDVFDSEKDIPRFLVRRAYGVFTENSPSSNGVFKSDEWSVHREHLIDKEKKNNIKENNTLADASGVADATYSIPEHTEDITNEQDESSDARMVEKEDNDMSDNNTKKNVPYVDELDFAETLDERDNFEETISFFLGSDVPVYKRKRELHKYLVDTYGVDVKDIEHLVSTLDMFYGSED